MDSRYFALQLRSAQRAYDRSGDFNAYMADCTYVALQIAANALAEQDRRLAHLPKGLTAAAYGIKGLVDLVADRLRCPVENGLNHEDFLGEFYHHSKRYFDRDAQVIRDILSHIGL
jgi:hypothetical protein